MLRVGARLLPFVLLTQFACGNSSNNPLGVGAGSGGQFSANLDGAAWQVTSVLADMFGDTLVIVASDANQILTIRVPAAAPGTFPIDLGGTRAFMSRGLTEGWASMFTGSVTVTNITASSAMGTFGFTVDPLGSTAASAPRVFTNGVFDVTF